MPMGLQTTNIVRRADQLLKKYDTRNPVELADCLGITIMPCTFASQAGAYSVVLNNRFIFIKEDLHPVMKNIVLLHEIGHDQLHRKDVMKENGCLKEFNIFNMRANRMEYEANIFAAQLSVSDEEFIEYVEQGYDIQSIARVMNSDINLLALKLESLVGQGYQFRTIEHQNDFLRYDKIQLPNSLS